MNKKKPTTEEIIRILPKADEGQTVEEDGWKAGPKFVQRIRRLGGVGIRVRGPRRGRSTASPTRAMPLNEVWNWDFVHDRTDNGVPLKMLMVEVTGTGPIEKLVWAPTKDPENER